MPLASEVGIDKQSDDIKKQAKKGVADVVTALESKGLSKKDAKRVAEYLVNSQELTSEQKAEVEGNKNIKTVAEELLNNPESTINERTKKYIAAKLGVEYKSTKFSEIATNSGKMAVISEVDVADKVSEDGKTIQLSTNESITINKDNAIAKTKIIDGERVVYFNTDKGVVSSHDVSYASENEALLYESFVDLNPNFANAVIKNYDGDVPVQTYINGMREGIILYGMHNFQAVGKDISKNTYFAELSDIDQSFALKLGRFYAESIAKKEGKSLRTAIKNAANNAEANENTSTKTTAKKGRVSFENGVIAKGKLQKRAVSLAKHLARAIGIDIVFYDSRTTNDKNGKKANGYFDEDTNSIHLDLQNSVSDAKTIAFTLSHELVHFIKKWSPQKYNTFAKFLMENYAKHGVNTSKLLANKMAELETDDADFAYEEMIADACETMLLDSNAIYKLMELRKTDLELFEKIKLHIHELLNKIRDMYKELGLKPTSDEAKALLEMTDVLEQMYTLFEDAAVDAAKNYQAASEVSIDKQSDDIKKQAKKGVAEDGRAIYESNFPKGTPKLAKSERILDYIKNVWSKKPINLVITNGETSRTILAKFDPTIDEGQNIPTDASKIAGGNRHGNHTEQRVTLDLADDYYEIASEATYNYSKRETGKDLGTHIGVKMWHYFVNDIYFSEYGEEKLTPYTVTINVKEKDDGGFVYSFNAEKESPTRQTLHAAVNTTKGANGELFFEEIVSQEDTKSQEKTVKKQLKKDSANPYQGKTMYVDSDIYDYAFMTSLDPMKVKTMPPLSEVKENGKVSQEKAVELGLANAKSIGRRVSAGKELYAIKNAYTQREIILGKKGLSHSLDASKIHRLRTNARLSAIGAYIVQNAIPINGLKKENSQANGTYAMACLVNDGRGYVVAIVTVDEFASTVVGIDVVDSVHSVNGRFLAKKEDSQSSSRELELRQESLSTIAISTINIADFLEIVNSTHRSILSNDVLRHFDLERPSNGYYADRVLFQKKKTTNREILSDALESAIDTSTQAGQNELKWLKEYQSKIETIEKEEAHLAEVNSKIKEISFGKNTDRSKLKELNEDKIRTNNRINIYDKQLMRIEAMKPIKDILTREKEMIRKRTEEKGREALANYRKDALKIRNKMIGEAKGETRQKISESRSKNEMRYKIRRVVADLRKLLNRGTRERNVKLELQDAVGKALTTADVLFSNEITNADIVRLGVESVTPAEETALDKYSKLLDQLFLC